MTKNNYQIWEPNAQEFELKKCLENQKKIINYVKKSERPTYFPFNDLNGYLLHQMPKQYLDIFDEKISKIKFSEENNHIKANHFLAGNIEHEYVIEVPEEFNGYINYLISRYFASFKDFAKQYDRVMSIFNTNELIPFEVFSLWVNFQKKYEFNPPHNHSGVFSFVIWHQIPFTVAEEKHTNPCKRLDVENRAGGFEFLIPDFNQSGITYNLIPVDKTFNGIIILFPAYLNHMVYPFYSSDEYRITIAGNARLSLSTVCETKFNGPKAHYSPV